jgi:hypothetical protein
VNFYFWKYTKKKEFFRRETKNREIKRKIFLKCVWKKGSVVHILLKKVLMREREKNDEQVNLLQL